MLVPALVELFRGARDGLSAPAALRLPAAELPFSLGGVGRLLAEPLPAGTVWRVRDGAIAPVGFGVVERLGDGRVRYDAGAFYAALAGGDSVTVRRLDQVDPVVAGHCAALARALRMEVKANVYLTPPHAQGFGAHSDGHDVLAVQCAGSKRWDFPERGERRVLAEGEAMAVRRGIVHDVAAEDDVSLHVTFGLSEEGFG